MSTESTAGTSTGAADVPSGAENLVTAVNVLKYFGDNEVRKGNLRAQYDVILYPNARVQIDGSAGRLTHGHRDPPAERAGSLSRSRK